MFYRDLASPVEAVCYPDGVDAAVEQFLALLEQRASKNCIMLRGGAVPLIYVRTDNTCRPISDLIVLAF